MIVHVTLETSAIAQSKADDGNIMKQAKSSVSVSFCPKTNGKVFTLQMLSPLRSRISFITAILKTNTADPTVAKNTFEKEPPGKADAPVMLASEADRARVRVLKGNLFFRQILRLEYA